MRMREWCERYRAWDKMGSSKVCEEERERSNKGANEEDLESSSTLGEESEEGVGCNDGEEGGGRAELENKEGVKGCSTLEWSDGEVPKEKVNQGRWFGWRNEIQERKSE